MKTIWLKNSSKDKLILFFNGWGMDKNPFSHLSISEYDILMVYDYQNISPDSLPLDEISTYKNVTLIGWSMGVWAAHITKKFLNNIEFSLAINGTIFPIHDDFGIPENVFNLTLDNMSLEGRLKFYRRMFKTSESYEKFLQNQPEREVVDQKTELWLIQNHIENTEADLIPEFDRVIIGKFDKIIPAQNQINFWNKNLSPIIIEAPHYPFFLWQSWEELINYAACN